MGKWAADKIYDRRTHGKPDRCTEAYYRFVGSVTGALVGGLIVAPLLGAGSGYALGGALMTGVALVASGVNAMMECRNRK